MTVERRVRRSHVPAVALELQLDALRTRAGGAAVVFADESGLPIAASGDGDACDLLAARAPLAVPGSSYEEFLAHEPLTVVPIERGAMKLFVACAIAPTAAMVAMLATAGQGAMRILGAA
ncbi:MAG: hypothetical protein ACHREM_33340 [Polyangiales bacterium]